MFAFLSFLLLAAGNADAQCIGNYAHFFEFGTGAGDTVVNGAEPVSLSPPIPALGETVNQIVVCIFVIVSSCGKLAVSALARCK